MPAYFHLMNLCCSLCPTDESCVKAVLVLRVTEKAVIVAKLCAVMLACLQMLVLFLSCASPCSCAQANTRNGFADRKTDSLPKLCMVAIPYSVRDGQDNSTGNVASFLLLLLIHDQHMKRPAVCISSSTRSPIHAVVSRQELEVHLPQHLSAHALHHRAA